MIIRDRAVDHRRLPPLIDRRRIPAAALLVNVELIRERLPPSLKIAPPKKVGSVAVKRRVLDRHRARKHINPAAGR